MEIHVEQRLTGRQLRDKILAKYGAVRALRAAAKKDAVARDDLFTLRLFEEDPHRLDVEFQTTAISKLRPEDLQRITPERIRLLTFLAHRPRPLNMARLTEALSRGKKNLSEDLHVLEELGILTLTRRGRDVLPTVVGNRIRLDLVESEA